MTTFAQVESGLLSGGIPAELVSEVLKEFNEAKRRYHLGDWGPAAVNGGRFTEAVLRVCDWATTGKYIALTDRSFKAEPIMNQLPSRVVAMSGADSFRFHFPRTLRVIYDIRNSRNTGHLSALSLNHQDARIVIVSMEWVLAELVRIYHNVPPATAEQMIEDLVTKEVPMIQMFEDFPRVLRNLGASDLCMVLLYWRGNAGAEVSDLTKWVKPTMVRNLRRTLNGLDGKNLIHQSGSLVRLTALGTKYVEDKKLIQPL